MMRGDARADERGFALLLVLWAMVLLALLATQVGIAGRSEATIAGNLRAAAAAQAATDGAVEAAAFRLLLPPPEGWPPMAARTSCAPRRPS